MAHRSKTRLDQGRKAVRLTPHAMRTAASYITGMTRYMRFHHTRQPGELSSAAIEAFLTPLAFE